MRSWPSAPVAVRWFPSKKAVDHFGPTTAAIGQGVVLSLAGKTGTSVVTDDYCTNGLKLGWRYAFTTTAMTLTGSDTFDTPNSSSAVRSDGGQETLSLNYAADLVAGDFLECAPDCTYAGINQMRYVTDGDGRTAVQLSWCMPESKKIYSIKRIASVPGSLSDRDAALTTFREVLILD